MQRDSPLTLVWSTKHEGPHHAPTWEATAIVNGVEYGKGTGPTQGQAKESAARMALETLIAQRGG